MLLSHCTLKDIDIEEENHANRYNWNIKPFQPGNKDYAAFVDMATAIGLVNRYIIILYPLVCFIFCIYFIFSKNYIYLNLGYYTIIIEVNCYKNI